MLLRSVSRIAAGGSRAGRSAPRLAMPPAASVSQMSSEARTPSAVSRRFDASRVASTCLSKAKKAGVTRRLCTPAGAGADSQHDATDPTSEGYLSTLRERLVHHHTPGGEPPTDEAVDEVINELDRLRILVTSAPFGSIDPQLRYGRALAQAKDIPGSLFVLSSLLPLCASDADRSLAFAALGEATDMAGSTDDACARYEEAVRLDPGNIHAWQRLGWNRIATAMRTGDPQVLAVARDAFDRGLAAIGAAAGTGDEADMLIGRGVTAAAGGARELAIEDYKAAIAVGVNHAPAYKSLGDLYLQSQDFKAAVEAFTQFIDTFQDHYSAVRSPLELQGPDLGALLTDTLLRRGSALLLDGQVDGAMVDFEHAQRTCAGGAPEIRSIVTSALGRAYLAKGDPWRCVSLQDEALSIHPENATAYMERSAAYRSLGDVDRAEEDTAMANAVAARARRNAEDRARAAEAQAWSQHTKGQ